MTPARPAGASRRPGPARRRKYSSATPVSTAIAGDAPSRVPGSRSATPSRAVSPRAGSSPARPSPGRNSPAAARRDGRERLGSVVGGGAAGKASAEPAAPQTEIVNDIIRKPRVGSALKNDVPKPTELPLKNYGRLSMTIRTTQRFEDCNTTSGNTATFWGTTVTATRAGNSGGTGGRRPHRGGGRCRWRY